jgi:site-specific recombinase XerD|tara:strand:+ start:230 stop:655 length:426 start_codon:yes stop_codon:yes gene_type:complete
MINCHRKTIGIISFSLILSLLVQPVQALNRSQKVSAFLFVSGIGLTFSGIYMGKSAQDSYDAYLQTARQSEIAQYKQDYLNHHTASLIMSRTGAGITGLALAISIWNQAVSTSNQQILSLPFESEIDFVQRQTNIVWRRRF